MSAVSPPAIAGLPIPPSTSDPANFDPRADAWNAAQQTFSDEIAALGANVYANAIAAAASAGVAAAAAGASIWVSGATYTIGAVRFSLLTQRVYRRQTDGAGTIDPSLDGANWGLVLSGDANAAHGAYTPAYVNSVNCAGFVPSELQWLSVGDRILVAGFLYVTPTASAPTYTTFFCPLPVPSTMSPQNVGLGGSGTVSRQVAGMDPVQIYGEPSSGTRAVFSFYAGAGTAGNSQMLTFSFAYRRQ